MDLYEVLGVEKDATQSDIKKAFRELSLKKHPDHGGTKEEFQLINDANEILSDPVKRKFYDETGERDYEAVEEMVRTLTVDAIQYDGCPVAWMRKRLDGQILLNERSKSDIEKKIVKMRSNRERFIKANPTASDAGSVVLETMDCAINGMTEQLKTCVDCITLCKACYGYIKILNEQAPEPAFYGKRAGGWGNTGSGTWMTTFQ